MNDELKTKKEPHCFKHHVVLALYVYKNQGACKNGRKIFRPYKKQKKAIFSAQY